MFVFAGMATCPCRSTWPSWSVARQRTSSPARRSKAPSVPSAPRTNRSSPRKNSTRYPPEPFHLYQSVSVGHLSVLVLKLSLSLFSQPSRTWPRNRQTTASPTWSPTSTARAESCQPPSTSWNSLARFSSIKLPAPLPASDQSARVYRTTHTNRYTAELHDSNTRVLHRTLYLSS